MIKFNFYHIRFLRGKSEKQLKVNGEIENLSGKDCNSVAIRLIIFGGNKTMVNTTIIVRGINYNQTKGFYKEIDVTDCNELLDKMSRYEIHVDSVY
ncbi:MAG: hypothetical protein PHF11_06930 [Candidatus Omnitrophica bacterium]|nr:hypothetical protein [Candidatus Omnitrophota bacterium]